MMNLYLMTQRSRLSSVRSNIFFSMQALFQKVLLTSWVIFSHLMRWWNSSKDALLKFTWWRINQSKRVSSFGPSLAQYLGLFIDLFPVGGWKQQKIWCDEQHGRYFSGDGHKTGYRGHQLCPGNGQLFHTDEGDWREGSLRERCRCCWDCKRKTRLALSQV